MTESTDNIKNELAHLYRNQLQIITGIIDMQLDFFTKNSRTETKESIQNRINSIVLLHNDLLNDKSPFYVDINTYLKQLLSHLKFDRRIDLSKLESAFVHSSQVLTFGLIIVEMIDYLRAKSNTLQNVTLIHFSGISEKEIYKISVHVTGRILQSKTENDIIRIKYFLGLCKQLKSTIIELDPTDEDGKIEIIINLQIQQDSYGNNI